MDEIARWVIDGNDDGYPDDVAVRLAIDTADAGQPKFWASVLDLAASIGLETHALPLPLFISAGAPVPDGVESVVLRDPDDIPGFATDGYSIHDAVSTPSEPASKCMTRLFTIDGALEDRDGDLLPDASRIAFDLPDQLPDRLGIALANLAARIGLESGGVTFPLVRDGSPAFVVRLGNSPATLRAVDGGWLAEGGADGLARLIEQVAATWPHIVAPEVGGAASAVAMLRRWLAGDGPEPNEPGDVIFETDWAGQRESDTLLNTMSLHFAEMLQATPHDEGIQIVAFACEPPEQRQQIADAIRSVIAGSAVEDVPVMVLSSFKAGLSWLREIVIPALVELRPKRVEITYQPYVSGDPAAMDMRIRWLQELFPGTELIAAATGLPLDAISVVDGDASTSVTYRAQAFGTDGRELGTWICALPVVEQPFIQSIEGSGTVAVTTGGFNLMSDNQILQSHQSATTLDAFWEFWQSEVIPAVLSQIDAVGGPRSTNQPFFGELLAEVWISAPNEQLGVREENDSAAEALAEDIYFTTLDAIELYGRQQTGERCNAPGAIIPIVHVTPGDAPRARVTIRSPLTRRDLPRPDIRVAGLLLSDDDLVMEIDAVVSGDLAPTRGRLAELSTLPATDAPSIAAMVTLGGKSVLMTLPLPRVLTSEQSSTPGAPPMDENIHGHTVTGLATQLAGFPEVVSWIDDTSYQGRPLVAMSLTSSTPGRLVSPTKTAILKPTHLIVARHHANEISSTNAAFQLAWLCATNADWRRYLNRVNVILLPYENPDGAALHVRLASFAEARTWKHHPARYNALGYEFSEDHFDPDTRFGEARVRSSVWRRWPADVVVDNHGVPSHEWIQPFAGFGSPPRFNVSYWIVQAILYGIVRYVDDGEYPEHQEAAIALRDAVSANVRDTDIGDWNRVYGESYRFWGQSRLPDRFPGEFHDDMLWHMSTGSVGPDGRGFAARYPKTTVLSWVTEVNDETAEGEHLERVARAHLLANQATLDLLYAAAEPPSRWRSDEDDRFTLRIGRERPLRLGKALEQ